MNFNLCFYHFSRQSSSCTGSIISKNVILTAAHCVERGSSNPTNIHVKFGNSDLGNAMNMAVKSIVKHPNLYGNLYEFKTDRDLALLKLSNDLEFNDAIQPISLPSRNYPNYNLFSSELIFAGYGAEEIDGFTRVVVQFQKKVQGNASEYLKFIEKRTKMVKNMKKIKVYLTMSKCNRYPYDDGLKDESLLFSSTHGAWDGDSGGPLMKVSSDSTNHEVIGVARSKYLCSSGIANTYTRVSKYVSWIQKNLEKFDEESTAYDLNLKFFGWMTLIHALTVLALYITNLAFYKFNSNDIRHHDADYEVREIELQRKTDADSLLLLNLANKIEEFDENTTHDLDLENYIWMFLIVGLAALAWAFAIHYKSEVYLVKINIV